ncbi:MAG: multicopper oxidase family protein [Thiohalomonadales bacterium]
MRKSVVVMVIGITTMLGFISACSNNDTPEPNLNKNDTVTLRGSVFKGPIDNAMIQLSDAAGSVLATAQSSIGQFQFEALALANQKLVFIKSSGGSYIDEATGQTVDLSVNTGLMSVLSRSELTSLAQDKRRIALTPETTLVAKIVSQQINTGTDGSQAIINAEKLVNEQLIKGTSPVPGVTSDTVMRIGDPATARPSEQAQALARNRAMSFSYEAKNRGLAPLQVFELIDKRATDLFDGILDGKQDNTSITMIDRAGNSIDLTKQNTRYALARVELLNQLIDQYVTANSTVDVPVELEAIGMDMSQLEQQRLGNQGTDTASVNLSATNLPNFQFLSILQDEDGNAMDNAASYTLDVMENVNVTINTPSGSWTTPMMRYNGLQHPPLIVARRGDQLSFTVNNLLREDTTVHWHGFKIPAIQDGGPDFPIAANSARVYSFKMVQAAAPLWFHPHPHENTAGQVYNGLAGGLVLQDDISDGLENTMQLPSGDQDIALLIQDRRFAADDGTGTRELIYDTSARTSVTGMLGDRIMVNDVELPSLNVATRQYRFRIYNGSNARTYNIALHNNAKFHVVATDGGLLPAPVAVDRVVLSAGERAEIVIDFSAYALGDKVMLVSRAFSGGQMAMSTRTSNTVSSLAHMGGGTGPTPGNPGNPGNPGTPGTPGGGASVTGLINGAAFDIMRFDVSTQLADNVTLYTALPNNADINNRLTAADSERTRDFVMSMAMGGMQFVINGKSFELNRVDELVPNGATEIWSISNTSMMAHPFHAHAIQWQVLDRNNIASSGIDLGWKDTVLVQPGETVRIMGRFDPVVNRGKYMYHCHILEHENAGMMGTFEVQ